MNFDEWKNFKGGKWEKEIDVRDFIQNNYTPYEGDDSFLVDATDRMLEINLVLIKELGRILIIIKVQ